MGKNKDNTNENSKNKSRINLITSLLLIGVLPMLTITVILIGLAIFEFNGTIDNETEYRLKSIASIEARYYESILKTNETIEKDYDFIDSLKGSNVDMTLFIGDERYMTSLLNNKGERIENTKADQTIANEVLNNGKDYYGTGVNINGSEYYVYYTPIRDNNNNIIGMAFAGKSEELLGNTLNILAGLLIVVSVVSLILFFALILWISQIIKKPLKAIAEELQTVSNGDINNKVEIKSNLLESNILIDSTIKLKQTLSSIVEQLNTTSDAILSSTDEIKDLSSASTNNTEQISRAINELATAAQSMAESVQNINGQVIEIGQNISDINDNILNLNSESEKMKQAKEDVEINMNTLLGNSKESVEAVSNINEQVLSTNESINQINDAVKIIIDIASQTKLLSLNASIEAARAGEFGKGFSVVADNIQQLSEQSNAGATQIKQIADEILKQSKTSVSLAANIKDIIDKEQENIAYTQDKLNILSDAIELSVNEVASIENKASTLNSIKEAIISDVNDLSAISEENAASNQEVTASVQDIANSVANINDKIENVDKLMNNLQKIIEYFK